MSVAFVYCRVSTAEQAEGGQSLEMQQADCEAWCADNGYSPEVFVDAGVSGRRFDRPALQQLLGRLDEADVLVVWKVDRLARDNVDRGLILRQCKKHQVRFVAVTQPELGVESPEARLVGDIVGAVSEFESEMIGARVRAAIANRVEGGEMWGKAPYGYKRDWTVDPEAAKTIGLIDRLYLGGFGASRITRQLNSQSILSPTGGVWWPNVVRQVLDRSVYSGTYEWGYGRGRNSKGVRTAVEVERLRTEDVYGRILAERKTRSTVKHRGGLYVFAGLLFHKPCGARMHGKAGRQRRDGSTSYTYRCSRNVMAAACPSGRNDTIGEDTILNELLKAMSRTVASGTIRMQQRNPSDAEAELAELDRRRERAVAAYTRGMLDQHEFDAQTEAHRRRRRIVEQQLAQDDEPRELTQEEVLFMLNMPEKRPATREWARQLLEAVWWDGTKLDFLLQV